MNKVELLDKLYNAPNAIALDKLIDECGLNKTEYWKPYGGNINNASTFENQQASAENALVEKITNSIDAVLMKECMIRGIDPKDKKSLKVPQTMKEASELFFGIENGDLSTEPRYRRNQLAQDIQIIATGDKKTPNVTVYDNVEGQNPSNFENTFLSIARGNKNDIPFVQGKYNMGSTGALVFCGDPDCRYQMIISKRNKNLKDSDGLIGFTIVRRHKLTEEEELNYKSIWYEYFVINEEIPYVNDEEFDLGLNECRFTSGSVVKLYSYNLSKPSIVTFDLWRQLNVLLFEPALPLLICERREYNGNSSEKVMLGNKNRIKFVGKKRKDDLALQKDYQLDLFKSNIPVHVYVFGKNVENTEYILKKPVIYTMNGQTQGTESTSFISQELKLKNLKKHMLVCVDCSQIGTYARQELFMASRDRLKDGQYYSTLKQDIVKLLSKDTDLKRLDQEYKGKEFKGNADDNDMVRTLFSAICNDKDMRKMFSGNNGMISLPVKHTKKEKRSNHKEKVESKELKPYPTVLRIKDLKKGSEDYVRKIRKGEKGRILLETDVENNFTSRSDDPGKIELKFIDSDNNSGDYKSHHAHGEDKLKVYISGPYEGEIKLTIEPQEEAEVGDIIQLSIKLISSAGELEAVAFIRIDEEAHERKNRNKKAVEASENLMPKLVRVVRESDNPEEATWDKVGMTANDIVRIRTHSDGAIESVLINMESNLAKKLMNVKGANPEKAGTKYVEYVYQTAVTSYYALYNYFSEKCEIDKSTCKEVLEIIDKAIAYQLQYNSRLLLIKDLSD